MTIDEAKQILEAHGYEVLPMPERCVSLFGPDRLWMNTEPHSVDYNAYPRRDVLQLAEALRDNQ